MRYVLFCVMLQGRALTDQARNALVKAACELFQKEKAEKKIKTKDLDGKVKTDGQYAGMGSVFGMRFYADIESEGGRSKVDFIVRTQDLMYINDIGRALEEGFWFQRNREREQAAAWN